MKYAAQFRRLAGLQRSTTIRIEGGLPLDYAPAKPQPPGSDLKHQHAVVTRGAGAQKAPEAVSDTAPGVKIAGRGS